MLITTDLVSDAYRRLQVARKLTIKAARDWHQSPKNKKLRRELGAALRVEETINDEFRQAMAQALADSERLG